MLQVLAEHSSYSIEADLVTQELFLTDGEYSHELKDIVILLRKAGETDASVQKCIVRYLGSAKIWGDASSCDGG